MSLPDSTADVTPGAGMMCQAPAGAAEAPPVPQHAVAAVAAQTMPQGIGTIPGMLPARVMTQ
ncbi:unnamed protein product, partial [Cladocopium goreaui]